MKYSLSIPLVSLLAFLTGCETQQLTLQDHGEQLAPALGADASDLQLLSYCQFQIVEPLQEPDPVAIPGILALSDSQFYLMTDFGSSSQSNYKIEIPIEDMEGISNLSSQVQFTHDRLVMVLWLNKAPSKTETEAKYATVSQLFAEKNVPEVAALREYRLRSSNPRWDSQLSNAGRYSPNMPSMGGFKGPSSPRMGGTPVASTR